MAQIPVNKYSLHDGSQIGTILVLLSHLGKK